MKKKDKTQGMVFVLPKSREFFGRISEDFQKIGSSQKIISERAHIVSAGVAEAEAKKEVESLKEIKENLGKLSKLHLRLKTMLHELEHVLKESED